jgi:hypothetical protein
MKKITSLVLTLCLTAAVFAQDMYTKKMQQTLGMMDTAKSTAQLQALAAQFERIGDAEKTKWLPYYYAALCNANAGFKDNSADKDKLAEKINGLLDKAEAIEKNSEIYCVRNMSATLQMLVSPMERYMVYGPVAADALEKAKQLDPTNPRPYYLQGVSVLNTPAAFGGGAKNAKPILQKAVDLYGTFKPASPLHPTWGKQMAESSLAEASK